MGNNKTSKWLKTSNLKSRLAVFLLIFIPVFLVCGCSLHTKNGANVVIENNYNFAKKLLNEANVVDEIQGHLSPQIEIELLDSDLKVVAEYIELQNELREYVGYIIIDSNNGHIYDYSNEGKLFEELLTKSGLTYDDALTGKVYFAGLFEIYIELTDGRIIDLMPQSSIYPSEITRSQLKEVFSLQ